MIKINKWWEQFENAGSRKLVTIRHFSSQSGNDSKGYRKLMRLGDEGVVAFGVFQALCQCMATLSQDARKVGEMRSSNGSILELEDISELTRLPIHLLTSAIHLLESAKWIECLESIVPQSSANVCHQSAIDLPLISQDTPNGEERRGEEGRGGLKDLSDFSFDKSDGEKKKTQTELFLEQVWKMFPAKSRNRSSMKKLTSAWKAISNKPSKEEFLENLTAWTKIEDWSRENGQYIKAVDIFIKDEKWRSKPVISEIDMGGRKALSETNLTTMN